MAEDEPRECDPACLLAPDDDERHDQYRGCLTSEDVAEERLRARDYEGWARL